jgi:ParB/RepB/Spo0J family partition protein
MTTETITEIPLDQLHESPFNPRKTFLDIEELAINIKAEGRIHQPLLVRPILHGDDAGGFELVFGHRRFRAAQLARLATAPCMVRAMTDEEARSAQIAENLARVDVHPIEEAEGFQSLIDTSQVTADDLAIQVGKSRSYVYGRLKLLQACPAVRTACLKGEFGSEVALLIARLRTPKLQEKALSAIKDKGLQMADGGQRSFREIRSLLAEKFTLTLDSALFDIEDEMLLPSAGHCLRCPKRSGNAPEFADLVQGLETRWSGKRDGSADICTDPDCFAEKKAAHLKREADKLRAAGTEVVDGNKARASLGAYGDVKGAFIALDKVKGLLKKAPKKGSAAAQDLKAPAVVTIQDPRTGKLVKAVRRADLQAAGVKNAPPPAESSKARQQAADQQRAKEHAQATQETARRMALLQAVRDQYATRPRDAFDLRLVAAAALSGVNYHDRPLVAELNGFKDDRALQAGIDHMNVAQLTALLMDCAIVDNVRVQYYSQHTKPGPLLALAAHYGIDAKAVRAEASGAAKDAATGDLLAGSAEETEDELAEAAH